MTKAELHRAICNRCSDIYAAKNKDYGDSFALLRKEYPEAILIRIGDKYNRLKQLIRTGDKPAVAESVDDTLMDLACYCLMELVERVLETGALQEQQEIIREAEPEEPEAPQKKTVNKRIRTEKEKTCSVCGKTFLGAPAAKFCSPECRQKGKAAAVAEKSTKPAPATTVGTNGECLREDCIFKGKAGNLTTCDYLLHTKIPRGCPVDNCDKYEPKDRN